jgi:hypothetical protein
MADVHWLVFRVLILTRVFSEFVSFVFGRAFWFGLRHPEFSRLQPIDRGDRVIFV